MSLAVLRGLGKRFPNGTVALDGFDLDIRRGEFLSLIGPSGCGKSTVLRLLAGLDRPSAGALRWEGPTPEIGFVFQDPTLMPWATAADNVYLPLRLRGAGRRESEARIAAVLDRVGLAGFAGHRPLELSGGMRMRVSIARALALEPDLLLMDEPFAALDEITRLRLNDDLAGLAAELGTTVVFVTHSVTESVYLSDRIVVMAAHPGRVAEILPIALPPGRTEAIRLTPAYAETCGRVSSALRRAMSDPVAKEKAGASR